MDFWSCLGNGGEFWHGPVFFPAPQVPMTGNGYHAEPKADIHPHEATGRTVQKVGLWVKGEMAGRCRRLGKFLLESA